MHGAWRSPSENLSEPPEGKRKVEEPTVEEEMKKRQVQRV